MLRLHLHLVRVGLHATGEVGAAQARGVAARLEREHHGLGPLHAHRPGRCLRIGCGDGLHAIPHGACGRCRHARCSLHRRAIGTTQPHAPRSPDVALATASIQFKARRLQIQARTRQHEATILLGLDHHRIGARGVAQRAAVHARTACLIIELRRRTDDLHAHIVLAGESVTRFIGDGHRQAALVADLGALDIVHSPHRAREQQQGQRGAAAPLAIVRSSEQIEPAIHRRRKIAAHGVALEGEHRDQPVAVDPREPLGPLTRHAHVALQHQPIEARHGRRGVHAHPLRGYGRLRCILPRLPPRTTRRLRLQRRILRDRGQPAHDLDRRQRPLHRQALDVLAIGHQQHRQSLALELKLVCRHLHATIAADLPEPVVEQCLVGLHHQRRLVVVGIDRLAIHRLVHADHHAAFESAALDGALRHAHATLVRLHGDHATTARIHHRARLLHAHPLVALGVDARSAVLLRKLAALVRHLHPRAL